MKAINLDATLVTYFYTVNMPSTLAYFRFHILEYRPGQFALMLCSLQNSLLMVTSENNSAHLMLFICLKISYNSSNQLLKLHNL